MPVQRAVSRGTLDISRPPGFFAGHSAGPVSPNTARSASATGDYASTPPVSAPLTGARTVHILTLGRPAQHPCQKRGLGPPVVGSSGELALGSIAGPSAVERERTPNERNDQPDDVSRRIHRAAS